MSCFEGLRLMSGLVLLAAALAYAICWILVKLIKSLENWMGTPDV